MGLLWMTQFFNIAKGQIVSPGKSGVFFHLITKLLQTQPRVLSLSISQNYGLLIISLT